MKDFDEKWYRYHMEEKEERYEMKDVFWYQTYDDEINVVFIPFYINHDKTKIKLLTNRKEFFVINRPVSVEVKSYTPLSCADEIATDLYRKTIYKPDIKKTLKIATDRIGVIYDSATILEKYYFSEDAKVGVKHWVENATRSQEEIFRMAMFVNKDYKKKQQKEK